MIMADISRQQKLASAKKKLKKFQKAKSPSDNIQKSHGQLNNEILNGIQGNHFFQTPPLRPAEKNNKNIQQRPNNLGVVQTLDYDTSSPISPASSHSPVTPSVSTPSVLIGGPRGVVNGEVSELESTVLSYKRSNQQLMEQVNEQRKQILNLQEKLKKDINRNSPLVEQRALKEQLEVHIQTIGILVSEKSELQSNLSAAQKKLSLKDSEVSDLNNQLNTAKQRVVDLEKALTQIQSNENQLRKVNQEVIRERDKISSQLYGVNQSKEEILLQNSELQLKLRSKVEECSVLIDQLNDLNSRLQKSELIIQQVSTNASNTSAIDSWQREKEELLNTINNQKLTVEKIVGDKSELMQKYNDMQTHYEIQLDQYKQQVNHSANENTHLMEQHSKLIHEIASLKDDLAKQQAQSTEVKPQVVLQEDNSITNEQFIQTQNEKQSLERELDLQISENRRLGKAVLEQNEKIVQLETTMSQLLAERTDKSSLLQQIQSDKETISRALQQNKQLKEQLEELEEGFVKMSNNSADLTTKLESEQHGNKDVAEKLSSTQVELEETRMELHQKSETCASLQEELKRFKEELTTAQDKVASKDMDIDLLNTQLKIVKTNSSNESSQQIVPTDLHNRLQNELSSAQDIINHLSYQNEELKKSILQLQEARNSSIQSEQIKKDDVATETETTEDEDEDIALAKSWEEDSTSDGGYTSEALYVTQAEVAALQTSIENLQSEREKILYLLQEEREKAYNASEKMEEHLELRMKQQLQQREREMQERYYEQIEALHLKIKTLQEAMEILRRDEDIADFDMVSDGITMPLLKTAFMQLQKRYKTAMDAKVQLLDRIEQLEDTNRKLETETETIGEYVALYQTQRQALKSKFNEKDSVISHLSNEHARMQTKVSQLHQLVMQMLSERSGIESQNKQLQELVNRRLALQSGSDGKEFPALENKLENLFGKVTVTSEDESELIDDSDITVNDVYKTAPNDNTTLQILNIFEQLESTGEGYQHGWLSPAARKHQFQPCVNCSETMMDL